MTQDQTREDKRCLLLGFLAWADGQELLLDLPSNTKACIAAVDQFLGNAK